MRPGMGGPRGHHARPAPARPAGVTPGPGRRKCNLELMANYGFDVAPAAAAAACEWDAALARHLSRTAPSPPTPSGAPARQPGAS